jgi:hypothetical protein
LELLQEAVEDVDVRAKKQAKHQSLKAEVIGDQRHDAKIHRGKNLVSSLIRMGLAISTLYGKKIQLEEGLAAGVDQLISHHLSALAATLKVEVSLALLLSE